MGGPRAARTGRGCAQCSGPRIHTTGWLHPFLGNPGRMVSRSRGDTRAPGRGPAINDHSLRASNNVGGFSPSSGGRNPYEGVPGAILTPEALAENPSCLFQLLVATSRPRCCLAWDTPLLSLPLLSRGPLLPWVFHVSPLFLSGTPAIGFRATPMQYDLI